MEFEKAKKLIDEANSICLITHKKPDGDAIGSVGAMYHFLTDLGKEVYMVVPDITPKFDFLPNADMIANKFPENVDIDLLICLDCSEIEKRTCIDKEDIEKAKKMIIIDHHLGAPKEVDAKIIDTSAPANCEIVYRVIKYMGGNISKEIASYLYLGILTDTGNFNFERTTGDTYRIAGELVDTGIDFTNICKKMNDSYSEKKMKLIAHVINNTETYKNGKIRVAVLDKDIQESLEAGDDDVDGLVNYLRCIDGTIASVYIRWNKDNEYKVSIRTEEPVDAALVSQAFNGGGHRRAAGFETTELENTKEKLIKMLEGLL